MQSFVSDPTGKNHPSPGEDPPFSASLLHDKSELVGTRLSAQKRAKTPKLNLLKGLFIDGNAAARARSPRRRAGRGHRRGIETVHLVVYDKRSRSLVPIFNERAGPRQGWSAPASSMLTTARKHDQHPPLRR
jgi:hypothetical protein